MTTTNKNLNSLTFDSPLTNVETLWKWIQAHDLGDAIEIAINSEFARNLIDEWMYLSNRSLNRAWVKQMVRDLDAKNWRRFQGDALKFTKKAVCIDGQHRIYAAYMANEPLYSLITIVPEEAFEYCDDNKTRTTGLILTQAGIPSGTEISPLVTQVHYWIKNRFGSTAKSDYKPTRAEALLIARTFQDELIKAASVGKRVGRKLRFHRTQWGIMFFLFNRINADLCKWFFDCLHSGEGKKSEPVFELRERVLKSNFSPKSRLRPREVLALTIKAWNATVENRPIRNLRFIEVGPYAESFPAIVNAEKIKLRLP